MHTVAERVRIKGTAVEQESLDASHFQDKLDSVVDAICFGGRRDLYVDRAYARGNNGERGSPTWARPGKSRSRA